MPTAESLWLTSTEAAVFEIDVLGHVLAALVPASSAHAGKCSQSKCQVSQESKHKHLRYATNVAVIG